MDYGILPVRTDPNGIFYNPSSIFLTENVTGVTFAVTFAIFYGI